MAATGVTAADILRVVRRRLGLILVLWVLCVGLAAGGTFAWIRYWPLYSASAILNVESSNPDKPYIGPWDSPNFVKDQVERAMRDQAMLITSQEVLQCTLTDPRVRDTYWWKVEVQGNDDPNWAMIKLREKLGASSIRDSSMVQVSFATRKIDDAPVIVNTVLLHYHNRRNEILRGQFREELQRMQSEVEEAQNQLQAKITEIQSYQAGDAAIPGIMNQSQLTVVTENLMTLGRMRTEAKARMEVLKSQYEAYQKSGIEQVPLTPEIIIAVESDPQIANLEMRAQRPGRERKQSAHGPIRRAASHRPRSGQSHPRPWTRSRSQRREKVAQYRHMQMERVRLDMLAAVDQVNRSTRSTAKPRRAQTDLDRKRAHLDNLMEEKKRAEERLDKARKALDDLNYVISRPTAVRISPMQDATRPLERSSPSWKINDARRAIVLAAAGRRPGHAAGVHEHLRPHPAGRRALCCHARARHRAGTR